MAKTKASWWWLGTIATVVAIAIAQRYGLTTSHYVCIVARLVVVRDESEEVL